VKAYVIEYASNLTSNWHNGGGALVVARDEEHAQSLLRAEAHGEPEVYDAETKENIPLDLAQADAVFEVSDDLLPCVWIFPDAGCC
jgi:hypothetical protein